MTNNKNVIVTLACNDAYVNYAMVLIYSIFANRNPDRTYEIKLFGNEITTENKLRIEKLTSSKFDVQVHDISQELQARASSKNLDARLPIDTYTRFFIVDKLTDYEKIIYLDSDTIVCSDIGILFDMDLNNKVIGATKDIWLQDQYRSKAIISNNPELTMYDYINNTLELKQPYNYFQAGVLLIDIKKMNEKLPLEKALTLIDKDFRLDDQDMLNYALNEDVEILDESWNLLVFYTVTNLEYARRNRNRTNLIHYAGTRKPWHKPHMNFGDIWWDYARNLHKINPLHNLKFPHKHATLRILNRLIKNIRKIFSN